MKRSASQPTFDYDFAIIGSGFGGSVSALRLAEKGYRVLVLEKGRRLGEKDFPKTNWDLPRWLWLPALRFFGLFKMTFFRHLTVLSGVGVGGGSLVYANTLPLPPKDFFRAPGWSHLADWEAELRPHYQTARRMLGATKNPRLEVGDRALQRLAEQIGRAEHFEPTTVGVYFGEPEVTVEDPYFGGKGPTRTGCIFCAGCMLGCRYNAKNTLDKNYLYLAEGLGAQIQAEAEVVDVRPLGRADGSQGYVLHWRPSTRPWGRGGSITARGVVFAGGVLGTVPLLLRLRRASLPRLSPRLGEAIRTNSESLIAVTTFDRETVFSEGVAIGSILHIDERSSLEPVRYPSGSGFWRLLGAPMVHGPNLAARFGAVIMDWLRHPVQNLRVYFVRDWARSTQILLYMRVGEGQLRLVRGPLGVNTRQADADPPTSLLPEARDLATRYAQLVNGKPMVMITETLLGIPTTAHIFGGCVMGADPDQGVIDARNRVFGYQNMYVCDGSMISANPGVNPSLTITALSERAMDLIPPRPA